VRGRQKRCFGALLITVAFALPVLAEDGQGWTFSGHFQGSSNSSGLVMKADPRLGYNFNRYVQTYMGVPFYMVNQSSSTLTSTPTVPPRGFVNGIGNAYIGFRVGVGNPAVNYVSTLEATAPTGDKAEGFSTGRATVDWTNTFSHKFDSMAPFADIGVANTVSDTSFFVRPFSSLGLVTHFDGGATFDIAPFVSVGGLAYGVQASGQQRIFSKVIKRGSSATSTNQGPGSKGNRVFETTPETVGSADLADDHGVSSWVSLHAGSNADFQVGYTRSLGYDLNTLFFGVKFRFGS
jgi:hypothetical protein